jgi:uncharacterized membrane protein YfcA
MDLAILVFDLAFSVSILSGMLGLGGGILLAPALLYLPGILGMDSIGMAEVTGLTIVQSLAATVSAAQRHHQRGFIDRELVMWMGGVLFIAAVAGSLCSIWISGETLKLVFAGLATLAASLMVLPRTPEDDAVSQIVHFNKPLAITIAGAVGLLGGMVGQGGSFILIPLMLHGLKLPTRVVIGTSLVLVFLSSSAGLAGKLATDQVPLMLAVFVVFGAVPGAQLGSVLGLQTPPQRLRVGLAIVIALGALGIGIDALT